MSLTLKLFSLVTRTAAKPIGNYIKQQAREHERFRRLCVTFAQGVHRVDVRMRLGLLQDPAAIERQIAREAAEAEERRMRAQRRPKDVPTVKTEAQARADAEAREKEVRFIEGKVKTSQGERERRMARPLSESKAIEVGANFISESFVFGVAVSLLLFETWRSRRKDSGRREDTKEKIEGLEDALRLEQRERGLLEEQLGVFRQELETMRRTASGPAPPTTTTTTALTPTSPPTTSSSSSDTGESQVTTTAGNADPPTHETSSESNR